jgi:tetratricopeptide (TPR) repeat protein
MKFFMFFDFMINSFILGQIFHFGNCFSFFSDFGNYYLIRKINFVKKKSFMNQRSTIVFFSVFLMLLTSCASGRLAKKGLEHEQAGFYAEAAELYYQSLQKNRQNLDARIGLRKTGQMVLDEKLTDFKSLYLQEDINKAVAVFNSAKAYKDRMALVGVDLMLPDNYENYYQEVENIYLEKKYKEGITFLSQEDFRQAATIFQEVIRLRPHYKNVAELNEKAVYEPVYREGMVMMEQKKYRTAYDLFDQILAQTKGYKNSGQLKAEALEKGTIRIAVAPFESKMAEAATVQTLQQMVESSLQSNSNPFIKIIDLTHSRLVNPGQESTLQSHPENLVMPEGADAILVGDVLEFTASKGRLHQFNRKGYVKKISKFRNRETGEAETKVSYDKVEYVEYEQVNSAWGKVNFKLIDLKTREVLLADIFSQHLSDKMHYARFDGNPDKIVPGYWKYANRKSSDDKILDNYADRQKLQRLFKAKKAIKSITQLSDDIMQKISQDISNSVNNFNPDL